MFFFSLTRWRVAPPFVVCLFAIMAASLLLRLLLARDGAFGSFAGARVGLAALAAHRQTTPMPQTAIAADLHQPPNAQLELTAQIAFDAVIAFQDFAHAPGLGFG